VPVDGGDVQAGPHRGPVHLEGAQVVLGQQRHHVAGPQARIVQDVRHDSRYLTTFGSTRAEAIFPVLSAKGLVLGTIDVESDRIDAFGSEDEAFLNQCATAIGSLWSIRASN